jgi:hypothetical protein
LKQAGAEGTDLVTTLERQGLVIRQFSKNGLRAFRVEAVEERPEWYVNLFASRQ